MFDKGAGSYNPGIDFTNTSMTSEYANSFKADELGIDQSIEHLIDRINDMPEMDGKPDISRSTIEHNIGIDLSVENAMAVMCLNTTVFNDQGKRMCKHKLDRDFGLNNRRTHFIFASVLYAIGGLQCILHLLFLFRHFPTLWVAASKQ